MVPDFFAVYWLLAFGTLTSASSRLLATFEPGEYIRVMKHGLLLKNKQATSCDVVPLDSRCSIVAASCLDYTSGTTLDTNTYYEAYLDNGNDGVTTRYKVESITVHPDFDPSNFLNDLAILQYNKDGDISWQGRVSPYAGHDWDGMAFMRVMFKDLDDPDWHFTYNTTGVGFDSTCQDLSNVFDANNNDILCSQNTSSPHNTDLNACKLPMAMAFSIAHEKAFYVGPYSYTEIVGGDSLCDYTEQRSYYTAIANYLAFIEGVIGRGILIGDSYYVVDKSTYDSNYQMVQGSADNNKANVVRIGGDFYKNQKTTTSSASSGSSSIESSLSESSSMLSDSSELDDGFNSSSKLGNADEKGLSHREKVIVAACVSVGGIIIISLILLFLWWKKWLDRRRSNLTYNDVLDSGIGGVSASSPSSRNYVAPNTDIHAFFASITAPPQNEINDIPPVYAESANQSTFSQSVTTGNNFKVDDKNN